MTDPEPGLSQSEIHLAAADLIGEGSRRFCYRYPGNEHLCIKIPMAKKNGFKQQNREVRYYQKLKKRGVPTERITHYHGQVDTNLGTGYVYDAIRDFDGSPSLQLIDYMRQQPERGAEYLAILGQLEDYLFRYRVIIYDLSAWNILCRRDENDALEPFIIDGVGDIVAIPVFNLSDRLVRQKIQRRWMRMIRYLTQNFDFMLDYQPSHYEADRH
ncbi:MAG: YrbL family protein [Gammaproteobacteria bacterium]|nr:YrbL family protein [Gammaproteobacteria bacterium]